ncbi:rhodanese-like domain-containing protein [Salinimicrobium sp. CDJ15-81-2]|nr:rhodanese-like domain-containing protein [Salinimicrobium nanhaiense]
MNKLSFLVLLLCFAIFSACNNKTEKVQATQPDSQPTQESEATSTKINSEPWTEEQLVEPAALAQKIETTNAEDLPVIISLGAGNIIPGSKDTGASGEKAGLENLQRELEGLPKDAEIVLYCGCCPFEICPNVRPAFSLLNEMGFTNHHLLNLQENIKVDWIDKGYAVGN